MPGWRQKRHQHLCTVTWSWFWGIYPKLWPCNSLFVVFFLVCHGLLNSCVTLSKACTKSMRTVSTGKTECKMISMALHTILVIKWGMVCIVYIPLCYPFLMVKSRNCPFSDVLLFTEGFYVVCAIFITPLEIIWVSHNCESEAFHKISLIYPFPFMVVHIPLKYLINGGDTELLAIIACSLIRCFFIFVLS